MSYDPHEAPCRAAFVGGVFFTGGGMGNATDGRDRLGDLTRQVFVPRAERQLSDEDVREIGENVVGFFSILAEWARAERQPIVTDPKTAQQIDKTLKKDGLKQDQAGPRANSARRKEGGEGELILRRVPGPVEATVGDSHAQQKGAPSQ